jgi:hypothetical protein
MARLRTVVQTTVLVVLSTAGAAGCLTGRAQTEAERPALDVPAPPDRVVPHVPPPEPPLPAIEPVEDLSSGTKPAPPTRNKPLASKPAAQDPPKPESKPDPPVTETPPPATPPPAPQLKLPENADAQSRTIRDTVERTRRMLGQTDRTKLSSRDRQKAFDDAQLFMKQAEDALNAKNLVFAKELADKAERLAKEVQNR